MFKPKLYHALQTQSNVVVTRSPVYYGWIVWMIATLGIISTSPAQNFTVAQFIDYMIRDFGLERSTISLIFSFGTLIGALGLTWVGRKIDQYGNRRAGVLIIGLFAVALVAFSLVTTPIMMLTIFIAVRGLGMGSLWLVSSGAISQWFIRLRGMLMSLTLVFFALWQTIYVPWLQRQLEVHDWRELWVMLGVIVGLVTVPVTWLLMRNRPEDFGLVPDGQRFGTNSTMLMPRLETNYTLKEAKGTAIFWIFISARVISPLMGAGLVFHQVSIFASAGHSTHVVAQNYAFMSIVTAISSILFGTIITRIKPTYSLALQQLAMIIALVSAAALSSSLSLIVYPMAFGILLGGAGVFDGTIWANLFGRLHHGAIRGFVAMSTITGSALGPILFGLSYDYLGGYAPILYLGAALVAVTMVLSTFARLPEKTV